MCSGAMAAFYVIIYFHKYITHVKFPTCVKCIKYHKQYVAHALYAETTSFVSLHHYLSAQYNSPSGLHSRIFFNSLAPLWQLDAHITNPRTILLITQRALSLSSALRTRSSNTYKVTTFVLRLLMNFETPGNSYFKETR